MHRDNEHDQIRAWQAGSLSAAQAFVRQRQTEIRSAAYLLTLDHDQARGLAEATFARFFRTARNLNPDADTRVELFVQLGRCFLRKEFESVQSVEQSFPAGPGPQKYGVENQRERTLAALGRLEERERVALILGEVASLEPGDLNRVVERSNSILAAPMETARQRLRQSLDIPQREPVRPALLEAGFDGPREDLWPLLEDQIAEIQRGEQRRGQLMTYGVVAAIVLVALIAIVALFGNDLISRNGDESAASINATAESAPDDLDLTPQPTVIPPTPTPTPDPLPLADVPNYMIVNEYDQEDGTQTGMRVMTYDLQSNSFSPVDAETDGATWPGIGPYWGTPDGERLLLLRDPALSEDGELVVVAVDSRTLAPFWEASIGDYEANPAGNYTMPPQVVVTSEAVYVAQLEEDGAISVNSFDLDDGSPGDTVRLEPDAGDDTAGDFDMVTLHLTPNESRLVVTAQGFNWRNNQPNVDRVVQLSLPDLMVVETTGPPLATSGGSFSTWDASMAIDGLSLYRIDYSEQERAVSVQFFDLDQQTWSTVEVPFPDVATQSFRMQFGLSRFTSHDGYRLYLISTYSGDVAVVHLTERRLERMFSIDTGAHASRFGMATDQFVFGWSPLLSMDGERLYVPAHPFVQATDDGGIVESGVWVIDLSEWTIADFLPADGTVEAILFEASDGSIVVRSRTEMSTPGAVTNAGLIVRLGRVDGSLVREPVGMTQTTDDTFHWVFPLPTLYSAQYGRSPAVDGVPPTDLTTYSTLPRVEARGQSNVVSDVNFTVTVRIFDPVSGDLMNAQRDDVRFDPDSTVTAYLTSPDQPGQLVVLNEAEPGLYRGTANLPGDGTWSINVSMISPDGATMVTPDAGTVEVSPTLTGSDGRRYQFRVSFDPSNPTVDEPANFRIRLVDVESGAVVPEDVHFNVYQYVLDTSIARLPPRLSMSLGNPVTYFGTRSIIAGQEAHGVWEGTITFADSGTWTASIRIQFAGIPITEIYVRTIRVNDAPEVTGLSPAEFWQAIARPASS